ncbi:copper resistance CopC family protein [Billgrantia sp. LNSP4103-1]|uniref:copper resistance CopC family protein n=1 Tax=Billgrantia sp. LNSP4103-1 TaxID=3410266 RepID=UPI00403F4E04
MNRRRAAGRGALDSLGGKVRLVAFVALSGAASPLWAEAELVESVPDDGARLEHAPDTFEIWLDEPVRLTLFAVSGPEGMVNLRESTTETLGDRHRAVPEGRLAPGEYRIVWRGTAENGTTSAGGYRFHLEK